MQFVDKFIWLDGQFIPWQQANVHVLAHHYGVSVFEGLRSYSTDRGSLIFRLSDHTDRLFRSAHILNMKIPYDKETLNQVQCEIIRKNQINNGYLRPFVFYGGEHLGLVTYPLSIHVMIAAIEWQGAYGTAEKLTDGISVRTSSFSRNHINSVFSKAKANGNYMNSILAMQEALACGAQDALLLDQQGCVAEGSGAHIFLARNGVLYTPELTAMIEGITRDTVMTLAHDLGLTVIEKSITRDEAYIADEAFFSGTAVEITPIREIDQRMIGQGRKGPITTALQEAYAKTVRGENILHQDWLTLANQRVHA